VDEVEAFGEIVLVVAGGLLAAIALRSFAERIAVPSAAVFLAAAAVAAEIFPGVADVLGIRDVERIAVVALVVILFEGGLHIGWARFRAASVPILSLGVLGTFATAGLLTVASHELLDMGWTTAALLGAAVAPTDPAVVFSVLGGRQIEGRTGTILEGESGANDPVGIALMIGLIELATTDDGSFWVVVREFVVEMGVGVAVGVAGWWLLLQLVRRVRLPEPALHPLRLLAAAGVIYGAAAVLHGSGFIAVFVAGVLLGDQAIPRKRESVDVLASLASLAEITVFVALGLTVDLSGLADGGVWLDGLIVAAVLALVVRPLVVLVLLAPVRLRWGERLFVTWSGLKGAVPILLAALAVLGEVDESERLYGLVFVVVLCSVVVQGTLVPFAAARLGVPMRRVDYSES